MSRGGSSAPCSSGSAVPASASITLRSGIASSAHVPGLHHFRFGWLRARVDQAKHRKRSRQACFDPGVGAGDAVRDQVPAEAA